jgi:ankyrin repeat protein
MAPSLGFAGSSSRAAGHTPARTRTRPQYGWLIVAIGSLSAGSSICAAAVYQCQAKDGSYTFSVTPCAPDRVQVVLQSPSNASEPIPAQTTISAPPSTAPVNRSPVPGRPSASQTAIYKCTAQDGSAVYAGEPCGSDAKPQEVVRPPAPPAPPSRPTTPSLTPEIIAAAKDQSARETSAIVCSTQAFNEWIKAQGHPLPDPNVRIAKLTEIDNQCRRPLHLPDMVAAAPIAPPKPVLSGPAGDAAAAMLSELVKSGSIPRLRTYLSSPGVDINDRPGTDKALLDYAAEQNQADVARFLIEHGARVDAMQSQGSNRGFTALHRTAIVDAAPVAEQLLAHGAEVNVRGPLGITPLILAASSGSRRTAEVLLNHGADISVPTGHRETALSEATSHGHTDIARLLLTHVPVPTTQSMNTVAARGDLEPLRLMLMHDELVHDVDIRSKNEALRMTILGGTDRIEERKQMIELLLAHGADIDNVLDDPNVIPLMFAKTPDLVEFMLIHGANHEAHLPGARLAQAYVCDDRVKDSLGVLRVLVSHGIDFRGQPSPRGLTAMGCAERSGSSAVVSYLKDHGADTATSAKAAATVATPVAPSPSTPTTFVAPPIRNPLAPSTAKERRASEVLTRLSNGGTQTVSSHSLQDRAQALAPYFLKKLDPNNADWSDSSPKWPAMRAIVEKDLLGELSNKPTTGVQDLEWILVREYAAKVSDIDLKQLSDYLSSPAGQRYAAFQIKLDAIYVAGLQSLQTSQPAPQDTPTEGIRKQRATVLALANATMTAFAQYEAAKSAHGDISGYSAIPILASAVSSYKGAELDALAARYKADLPEFVTFTESATAKHHFAAMAAAQATIGPLFATEIEQLARNVEANHMAQWQKGYQEQIKNPARP